MENGLIWTIAVLFSGVVFLQNHLHKRDLKTQESKKEHE